MAWRTKPCDESGLRLRLPQLTTGCADPFTTSSRNLDELEGALRRRARGALEVFSWCKFNHGLS